MKYLIVILIILIPISLSAMDNMFVFTKDGLVEMNTAEISYFTRNYENIDGIYIDGNLVTKIFVVEKKKFHLNIPGMFIDDYFVQFIVSGEDIILQDSETWFVEFDFKTKKKLKYSKEMNDNKDYKKPKKEKLKDKIKNKLEKNKPSHIIGVQP